MTLFIPILGRNPSGCRNSTLALIAALEAFNAPLHPALEGFDGDRLKTAEQLAMETNALGPDAVFVYAGAPLIGLLRDMPGRKAATTYLSPMELRIKLKLGPDFHSIARDFGLAFFSCPRYALEILDPREHQAVLQDSAVFLTEIVPAFLPPVKVIEDDPVFNSGKVFAVSLPGAEARYDDAARSAMAQLIAGKMVENYRIVLVPNPRSAEFLDRLLPLLPAHDYDVINQTGAFAARVLPGLQRNPGSLLYLPGDSASVQAEAMAMLAPAQIVVNAVSFIDHEHGLLAHYFHQKMGRVSLLAPNGIQPPPVPPQDLPNAAREIAGTLIARFMQPF